MVLTKSKAAWAVTIICVIFLSYFISKGDIWPLYLLSAFLIGIFVLFKSSDTLLLVISVVILGGGYGLFNSETLLHVSGLFKLPDLLLLIMVIIHLAQRLKKCNYNHKFPSVYSVIFLIIIVAIIQIVATLIRFNVDLGTTLATGRRYLYFAFALVLIDYLSDSNMKDFLRKLDYLGIFLAILYVIQTSFGSSLNLLASSGAWGAEQDLGGVIVNRIYWTGYWIMILMYSLTLSSLTSGTKSFSLIRVFKLALYGTVILLSYSRGYWIAAICIAILQVILSPRLGTVIHKLKYIVTVLSVLIILYISFSMGSGMSSMNLQDRLSNGFYDILNGTGTMGYRMAENQFRLQLFYQYPILGPGFVGPLDAQTLFQPSVYVPLQSDLLLQTTTLQTPDSGWLAVLMDMGLVGLVIWTMFYISIYREWRKSCFSPSSLGSITFLIALLLLLLTGSPLTTQPSIIVICLATGIIVGNSKSNTIEQKGIL